MRQNDGTKLIFFLVILRFFFEMLMKTYPLKKAGAPSFAAIRIAQSIAPEY